MPNPFTIQPVTGKDFYNRNTEIEDLISGRNHTLIVGARRLGKTSLMREVQKRITDESPHLCVYLTTELFRDMEGMKQWFQRECRKSNMLYAFHSLGIKNGFRKSERGLFEMLSEICDRLVREDLLLFIIIDEVNILADFDDEFLQQMRECFLGYPEIRWIFAGSQNVYELRDLEKPWLTESFLAAFITETLGNLGDDEAAKLIQQSKSGHPLKVEDKLVETICHLTYKQPFLIQLLCYELYHKGTLNDVTQKALDETLKQCINNKYFKDSFDKLYTWIQKSILLEVSKAEALPQKELRRFANRWFSSLEKIQLAVHALVDLCYLKKENGTLKVSNYFFERWLETNWKLLSQELEQERTVDSQGKGHNSFLTRENIKVNPIQVTDRDKSSDAERDQSFKQEKEREKKKDGDRKTKAPVPTTKRNQVFISYSHHDKEWLERLHTMLTPIVKNHEIVIWNDKQLPPGAIWEEELEKAVASTLVAVLLISPSYLASDFILEHELNPFFEAAMQKVLKILWVPLTACGYDATPINDFQAVIDPSEPLDTFSVAEQNQRLAYICKEIEKAVTSYP